MSGAVLIVEDEPGLRQGLCDVVKAMGCEPLGASGLGEARGIVAARGIDCVLLDIRLRDGDGLDYLGELRATARGVPVIVATAYGDSERTIRAMRDGAFDYLTKPFDLEILRAAIERALNQRALAREVGPAPDPLEARQDLVGTSAAMLAIWKLIGRAAASTAPVLITGETGTGKELVARAIHAYSPRARGPFVAVNQAALPPTLIESELFGHERGAFTGATARRTGRFEAAAGGTLFLDEIGDLDQALQAKLLRVVQEGTYERVGGNDPLASDARLIAATNRPVRPGAAGVALREELYYRLAVIEIELPPLRARRSDIPLLVAHALRGKPARAVSEAAMQRLLVSPWPGNVRELFHVIERTAVLCGSEVIDVGDLPDGLRSGAGATAPAAEDDDLSLHGAVARVEKQLIVRALERAKGNRSAAARLLGIGRPQLYAKLEEHGLGGTRGDGTE
ncbi:MAG TPA: sigma-54 dependent transcriptional regulator [Polyangia bacterium]|jgi:DNA-binding NtrC family response regulator|nr:sigma-54 dependent transcriptional regulator [Polyangia bacterium]